MSLRLEMLQVARLARKVLGESAELTRKFVLTQINEGGAFKDRTGKSDLYYTVFGLESLIALEVQHAGSDAQSPELIEVIKRTKQYLRSFDNGGGLDFVHLCCLPRCWAAVSAPLSTGPSEGDLRGFLERLGSYRTQDGGYNPTASSQCGTAYAAFLALGAYQDCGAVLPEPRRLVQSLKHLETPDGAWTNERISLHSALDASSVAELRRTDPRPSLSATNATAAAVAVLRNLGQPLNPAVGAWLVARAHPQGGFRASPTAPMPDLLSTATALHALAGLEVSFATVKELCLDFVDSLWTNEGGFYGQWGDDHL